MKEGEEGKEGEEKEILPFSSPEFAAAWQEWKDFRKSKKKPLSALATSKTFKKLSKFTAPECIDAIDEAIGNDWSGIFPKSHKPSQQQKPTRAGYEDPGELPGS